MKIVPVKQKTVTDQVIEQLKGLIVSGVLKPNDKMPNEYELAEKFGVGRSTIREVLKIFQYMGVIELRNPKGTYICESSNISSEALLWSMLLGRKDFSEIIELRVVMEQQGLWYLLEYHKEDKKLRDMTINNLKSDISSMRKAIKNNDIEDRLSSDYNFHGHIIQVCQNEIFKNLYRTMKSFMFHEIDDAQKNIESLLQIPENHEKLLQAIVDDKYDTATDLFRHHIKNIDTILDSKINT